jgi:RimJ/RimL family protein N-acetyltransferase
MFRIETVRLIIRPWSDDPDDRASFVGMASDPDVMRYVHDGTPFTPAEVEEFLARQARQLAEHGFCMGALVEKQGGRVVGVAGAQPLGTTGELEIGWWVARDRWGRGYATEAGRGVLAHVLETLGHARALAIIDVDNAPSRRVADRLGMSLVGRRTGADLGHRRPEIVVDLYAREAASRFAR